jgi:hypothetical protein
MHRYARRTDRRAPEAPASAPAFHGADVLYALEWAAIAPGLGGWNVALDDELHARLVSITPPGAEQPTFFISRSGDEVVLAWLRPNAIDDAVVEVGRFASLRAAVQVLCPLSEAQCQTLNESMEMLYPRKLRAD